MNYDLLSRLQNYCTLAALREIEGVVYQEIAHPNAELELDAVWRKGKYNPVLENFMRCLDAELALDFTKA